MSKRKSAALTRERFERIIAARREADRQRTATTRNITGAATRAARNTGSLGHARQGGGRWRYSDGRTHPVTVRKIATV